MHVPDGFFDMATSLGAGAAAAAGLAVAWRGARRELDERTAPLAGLTAVFVFAGQMINFQVGSGTSGHLLGEALAAVLVGPFTASLCLAVVLLVQVVLFADGGLTALGINVLLFSVVAVWASWAVFAAVRAVLPRRTSAVLPATFLAALVSVPVTAVVFVGLYALGGQAPIDLGAVATAMIGWHALIGIGEAVISTVVVAAILAFRPDLVHGARPGMVDPVPAPRGRVLA